MFALCYLAYVFDVVFCIAWSVVYYMYLNVSFFRLITSVGEKRVVYFAIDCTHFGCFYSK